MKIIEYIIPAAISFIMVAIIVINISRERKINWLKNNNFRLCSYENNPNISVWRNKDTGKQIVEEDIMWITYKRLIKKMTA